MLRLVHSACLLASWPIYSGDEGESGIVAATTETSFTVLFALGRAPQVHCGDPLGGALTSATDELAIRFRGAVQSRHEVGEAVYLTVGLDDEAMAAVRGLIERRGAPRISMGSDGICEVASPDGSISFPAQLVDVSTTGCRIRLQDRAALLLGGMTELKLKSTLPGGAGQLDLTGRVRNRTDEEGGCLLGVEYEVVSAREYQQLQHRLDEFVTARLRAVVAELD